MWESRTVAGAGAGVGPAGCAPGGYFHTRLLTDELIAATPLSY